MLRELQVIKDKPAIASYKAGETTISTGMAVVKNETDKTFEFASAETAADLYFVDKERIPTGVRLSANTAGKIVKAATTVESKYVCGGFYTDNGHKLVIVEVSDTTGKNAS